MKARLYAVVFTVFAASAAGCFDGKENVDLLGVRFQRATVEKNGFVIGFIGEDAVIGGRPCRKGWVHLHPNGVPAGFTASRDIALNRFTIPAGTWVFQDTDGVVTVCAFPRNMEVQGHECRGGFGGSEGVQTAFYPDGALKQFFAPKPVLVDGIPCGASVFQAGIQLYENGRLKSATLTEDIALDGRLHRKGERIRLTPEGRATGG